MEVAEALDKEADFLEQELERAEALLKLPPQGSKLTFLFRSQLVTNGKKLFAR